MNSPTPRPVSVVMFDLDDTLFAHSQAVARGIAAHRRVHGGAMEAADDAAELERWRALEELHYHRYLAGELTGLDQRRYRARGFVEPFGLDLRDDAAADEWFGRYLVEYRRGWGLFSDVEPCLDQLEVVFPGVRFGIVTNAELPFQQSKLEATGLAGRMEHVVASGDVGAAKPDSRIFEHACSLFGVAPAQAVYVGDRLDTDALGAARAGLTGVWLNRTVTRPAPESHAGVLVIHALRELVGALTRTAD